MFIQGRELNFSMSKCNKSDKCECGYNRCMMHVYRNDKLMNTRKKWSTIEFGTKFRISVSLGNCSVQEKTVVCFVHGTCYFLKS